MQRQLLLASAATLIVLAACSKKEDTAAEGGVGQSPPVNAVQDMAAGPVGMGSAATVGANTTEGFVSGAAMGDMYEIEASKIAAQKAKDPKLKAFANMLIADHTAMSAELKAAVASSAATTPIPATLDERRQGMIDNLKAADGDCFDLAYMHQQLAAHLEALTMHKGYSTMGDNAGLKAVAEKAAPKVQHHIDELRKIGGDKLKDAMPGT